MKRTNHITNWSNFINNKHLVKEGLITSWNNITFYSKINNILKKYVNFLSYEIDIESEDLSVMVFIYDLDKNKRIRRELYEKIIELVNISGFYMIQSITLKDFLEIDKSIIKIEFCKKFSTNIGIPEYLYHVTHPQYIEKIEKKGLIPKSKKIIEDHPERVYFVFHYKEAIEFAHLKYEFTLHPEHKNYVILKIDTKKLGKLKLYEDSLKTNETTMCYTYDNIPPYAIETVEKNEVNI